jgi:RNA polymerase sigma-54 factor
MRLDTSQQLRLEQRMKLAPRIIQAMEILQLPVMALQERIDAELQSNPVLEMRGDGDEPDVADDAEDEAPVRGQRDVVVDTEHDHSEDFNRLRDFEDEHGLGLTREVPRRSASSQERDRKLDAMANAPAPGQSLTGFLMEQWAFVEAAAPIKQAGALIISFIEEDGYVRTALEELPAHAEGPVSLEDLRAALRLVQALEPVGVGARDIRECLLLQLRAEQAAGNDMSLEIDLVQRFLRDIEMNRLPLIARRTGKTLEQIKRAIENLSHLNPRPGTLVGARSVPVIVPDATVELDDQDQILVKADEADLPGLRISKVYRRLVRDRQVPADARAFLQRNIRSAQWLMGAIEQRRHTVRRVVEEVFKVQRAFLDEGSEALRPLPMADVARKVGVHVATVSRAVAGKYVQTPRGIFPLRMFFSGGTTTAAGQEMAWDAVRAKLREVIDTENKSNPLSDDDLAAQLSKHGLDIARRTVAKYRKLMGIPPARQRKAY